MEEPLENLYFNWLYTKVVQTKNVTPTTSYEVLLKTLHNTEFVWLLSGDDNRAEDGKELRREFLILGHIPDNVEWRTQVPCSVLEMLIAFSRRAALNSYTSEIDWFWEFLENLSLKGANDASRMTPEDIQEFLDHFMWRNYSPDGVGGLFPMQDPQEDQTEVEIWQQFCDYLVDQNRLP